VRDAEGTITGVLAVAIDVTAQVQSRKKIEEAEEEAQAMNEELTAINEELSATNEQLIAANNSMHESEEQFRNLANAIPQLAWIADGEGWIFWYNNRWYEFTGTNFEQMQGWGWEKVHHPDHRDHVVAFVKEAWKRAEPFELTFPLLSKEGDWHWFLTRAVPIFSSGGKLVRWFGTNTDVTEQREALELNKQLLKEMEYERNRFEAIVKQMPGSVVIGEAPSGKLIFANEKLLEVWGHPLIESQNIEEYIEWIGFHPDGRRYEGHEWPLARAIQKGETVTNEDIDIIRGDDKPATLRLSAAPIKDSTGNVIAGVVISQDVTEFKAAIKSRDEFLSIASHELKTPLTTLTASIQMLMRVSQKDPASPLLSQLIETSAKSTGKLAGLVQELLNLSNIESGQLKLKKTRFRLMELVNECRIHVTLSGTHEIFVIGDPEIEVEADRSRVDQVILNFLNNAVKYSPQANEVRLAVEREGNKAKISVIDKGIGIEEEKIPYVFDRYYRVDSSGVQFAGLGLGLYICAEIVKIHGGEIGVVSEPGKGSTFWFTLPLF
jgi:PAS domain S-box-containing protein